MHQKQPPAKTAVLVSAGEGFCPWLFVVVHAANQGVAKQEDKYSFHVFDIGQPLNRRVVNNSAYFFACLYPGDRHKRGQR